MVDAIAICNKVIRLKNRLKMQLISVYDERNRPNDV